MTMTRIAELNDTSGIPLSERAMLVKFHVKKPSFRKTDRATAERVARESGGDPAMHNHTRLLIARKALADLESIVSEARLYHYNHTLPWEDEGIRVLPTPLFDSYNPKMLDFKRQFDKEVDKFVPVYPLLIEAARPLLGKHFDPLDYPHPMEIHKRFEFTVKTSQLYSDFRCSAIGEEEEARIRAEIEARTEETLNATVHSLFEKINEYVTHVIDRLNAFNEREQKSEEDRSHGGFFRDSMIGNLRTFVERLPALNITKDPRIDELRQKLERQICVHNPEDLRRSPDARNIVLEQAQAIHNAVADLI